MNIISFNNTFCIKVVSLCIFTVIVILGFDYKFAILPFHGYFLGFYVLFVFLTSAWIAFVSLQSLLRQNKPIEFNFEKGNYLSIAKCFCDSIICHLLTGKSAVDKRKSLKSDLKLDFQKEASSSRLRNEEYIKSRKTIDDRIEEFVMDVEKRFILKWYKHISSDKTFPSETKVLLDEITRRFLQVVVEVDNKKLTYGILAIFLNHMKEFRKTVKRVERNGGTVEEMYRYTHTTNKSPAALEVYIHRLTTDILKQFITWELYSSLPCKILVSILAKKLVMFLLNYLSSPGFLNYKILRGCRDKNTIKDFDLNKYSYVSLAGVNHSKTAEEKKEDEFNIKLENKGNIIEKGGDQSSTPKKVVKPDEKVDDKTRKPVTKETGVDEVDTTSIEFKKCVVKPKAKSTTETAEEKKHTEVVLRSSSKIKKSEPVKIYESKSANKTWRNSSDLQCISLGQDLLALQDVADPDSQIQTLIEKKLWKDNTESIEEEEKAEQALDSHEHITASSIVTSAKANLGTNYSKAVTNTTALISNTIKPIGNVTANTLHNMKEFQQNTVNTVVRPVSQATTNAMHKIENFQDEAAGVVEGILDFGIAGLKKGLRLTGLQDNFSDITGKSKQEQKVEVAKEDPKIPEGSAGITTQKIPHKLKKVPHITSEEERTKQTSSSEDSEESVWINPLKESPNFDGNILLEKTPEVEKSPKCTSRIEKLKSEKPEAFKQEIPKIAEDVLLGCDSPEPEYEEAADFATTIAKLRTLLQQKSSESGMSTPSLSPMPPEELQKPPVTTPSDLQVVQALPDSTKVDGTMPSLYKFCARTATGVFQNTLNTIKTALPGNINEPIQGVQQGRDNWTFVEANSFSDDFQSRMERLISERKVFCTVDTAYEAINSLDVTEHPEVVWTGSGLEFDDELDEFDSRIPITKTLVDIICELVSDSNTYLVKEPVVKMVLLLFGNSCENFFNEKSETLLYSVNKYVGKLPENINDNVMPLTLDEMVECCMECFPDYMKKVFGERTLESALRLFISSLQSHKINQHVFVQMFELCASELILANNKFTPAYSA